MSTMSGVVDDVRGFNRFYTRVLGLLRPDLAGSAFGLTEARVLFELAHRDDVAVSDLRRDLDLDAGYLSRILSGFTASGLVAREKSAADGRRQVVRLTDEGRQAFDELDRLQAGAIDTLLAPLDDGQRNQLVGAMGQIRRMLGSETRWTGIVLRPPQPGDLGWVVERHGARYAAEYGWDATFEALVARIVADFAERRDTQREAAWIAELDGERVGCVFCTAADAETPHSCGCCSSTRRRAGRVSGPGWWTSACDSPGDPAIGESRCGPTMYSLPPAGSTSGPVSGATVASRTIASGTISSASTGHETCSSNLMPPQRQAVGAAPSTRWMSGFMACNWPPQ